MESPLDVAVPVEVLVAAFDAAPVPMAVLDESGLVVRANAAFAAAAGDRAVAIAGRELFGSELADAAGAELVERLRSGAVGVAQVHGRLTAADGSVERVTLGVRALDQRYLLAFVHDAVQVPAQGSSEERTSGLDSLLVLTDTLAMLLGDDEVDGVAVLAVEGVDASGAQRIADILRPGDGAAQLDATTCIVVAVTEDRTSADRLRERVVAAVADAPVRGDRVRVGLVWTRPGPTSHDADDLITAARADAVTR